MNTVIKKIISTVVVITFTVTNLACGLSPAPGSNTPGTREGMYTLGQKLFGIKRGPGAIDFDRYKPGSFIGAPVEQKHVKFFQKAGYPVIPEGWKNNPLLQKTDLIEAFKCFRDTEARISAENLDIREGYFEVEEEEGELPIARIEDHGNNKYVLIIHTKFVQMWNHIRQNDVWFDYEFPAERGRETRTVSLAWALFYRVAKHEMSDLRQVDYFSQKSFGHISYNPWDSELRVHRDENKANKIDGKYWKVNDAAWMWFLMSYCFTDATRYNNNIFRQRLEWVFGHENDEASKLGLPDEFYNLAYHAHHPRGWSSLHLVEAAQLASSINYHFFSRPGVEVPELTVDEGFVNQYTRRQIYDIVGKPIPATGANKGKRKRSPKKQVGGRPMSGAYLPRFAKLTSEGSFTEMLSEEQMIKDPRLTPEEAFFLEVQEDHWQEGPESAPKRPSKRNFGRSVRTIILSLLIGKGITSLISSTAHAAEVPIATVPVLSFLTFSNIVIGAIILGVVVLAVYIYQARPKDGFKKEKGELSITQRFTLLGMVLSMLVGCAQAPTTAKEADTKDLETKIENAHVTDGSGKAVPPNQVLYKNRNKIRIIRYKIDTLTDQIDRMLRAVGIDPLDIDDLELDKEGIDLSSWASGLDMTPREFERRLDVQIKALRALNNKLNKIRMRLRKNGYALNKDLLFQLIALTSRFEISINTSPKLLGYIISNSHRISDLEELIDSISRAMDSPDEAEEVETDEKVLEKPQASTWNIQRSGTAIAAALAGILFFIPRTAGAATSPFTSNAAPSVLGFLTLGEIAVFGAVLVGLTALIYTIRRHIKRSRARAEAEARAYAATAKALADKEAARERAIQRAVEDAKATWAPEIGAAERAFELALQKRGNATKERVALEKVHRDAAEAIRKVKDEAAAAIDEAKPESPDIAKYVRFKNLLNPRSKVSVRSMIGRPKLRAPLLDCGVAGTIKESELVDILTVYRLFPRLEAAKTAKTELRLLALGVPKHIADMLIRELLEKIMQKSMRIEWLGEEEVLAELSGVRQEIVDIHEGVQKSDILEKEEKWYRFIKILGVAMERLKYNPHFTRLEIAVQRALENAEEIKRQEEKEETARAKAKPAKPESPDIQRPEKNEEAEKKPTVHKKGTKEWIKVNVVDILLKFHVPEKLRDQIAEFLTRYYEQVNIVATKDVARLSIQVALLHSFEIAAENAPIIAQRLVDRIERIADEEDAIPDKPESPDIQKGKESTNMMEGEGEVFSIKTNEFGHMVVINKDRNRLLLFDHRGRLVFRTAVKLSEYLYTDESIALTKTHLATYDTDDLLTLIDIRSGEVVFKVPEVFDTLFALTDTHLATVDEEYRLTLRDIRTKKVVLENTAIDGFELTQTHFAMLDPEKRLTLMDLKTGKVKVISEDTDGDTVNYALTETHLAVQIGNNLTLKNIKTGEIIEDTGGCKEFELTETHLAIRDVADRITLIDIETREHIIESKYIGAVASIKLTQTCLAIWGLGAIGGNRILSNATVLGGKVVNKKTGESIDDNPKAKAAVIEALISSRTISPALLINVRTRKTICEKITADKHFFHQIGQDHILVRGFNNLVTLIDINTGEAVESFEKIDASKGCDFTETHLTTRDSQDRLTLRDIKTGEAVTAENLAGYIKRQTAARATDNRPPTTDEAKPESPDIAKEGEDKPPASEDFTLKEVGDFARGFPNETYYLRGQAPAPKQRVASTPRSRDTKKPDTKEPEKLPVISKAMPELREAAEIILKDPDIQALHPVVGVGYGGKDVKIIIEPLRDNSNFRGFMLQKNKGQWTRPFTIAPLTMTADGLTVVDILKSGSASDITQFKRIVEKMLEEIKAAELQDTPRKKKPTDEATDNRPPTTDEDKPESPDIVKDEEPLPSLREAMQLILDDPDVQALNPSMELKRNGTIVRIVIQNPTRSGDTWGFELSATGGPTYGITHFRNHGYYGRLTTKKSSELAGLAAQVLEGQKKFTAWGEWVRAAKGVKEENPELLEAMAELRTAARLILQDPDVQTFKPSIEVKRSGTVVRIVIQNPEKENDTWGFELSSKPWAKEAKFTVNHFRNQGYYEELALKDPSELAGLAAQVLEDQKKLGEWRRWLEKASAEVKGEKGLIEIIAEYAARIGEEKGPGATKPLTLEQTRNVWEAVNLLHKSKIEIFLPQSVGPTEDIRRALRDIKRKEGGDIINLRPYTDVSHLKEMLSSEPESGVKRMVIAGLAGDHNDIGDLVEQSPELFKDSRALSVYLPNDYSNKPDEFKSMQQAKILMIALMARLVEKDNKTPRIETALRDMLDGCMIDINDDEWDNFFKKLTLEDDNLTPTQIKKRLFYFLTKPIYLTEVLDKQIRLMKKFWIAA